MINILQGDSLAIPVTIAVNGQAVTPKDITTLRVTIGTDMTKTYPDGEIYYENGAFLVPISQQESFRLPAGKTTVTIRPKFTGGNVRGTLYKGVISVLSSPDKAVI